MRQPKAYQPVDLDRLDVFSIAEREHKVHLDDLASPAGVGASLAQFFDSLPSTPVTAGLPMVALGALVAERSIGPFPDGFSEQLSLLPCSLRVLSPAWMSMPGVLSKACSLWIYVMRVTPWRLHGAMTRRVQMS